MLQADKNTFANLSPFEAIEDLNEAVRHHLNSHSLSPTEWEVLSLIARHSCKYVGVSYLSKNKIAEQVGKSRRTIIRVCNRLESLGIITQHEARRVSGDRRQTANITVINAYTDKSTITNDVTPEVSRQEASSIKLINNTYKDTLSKSDKSHKMSSKEKRSTDTRTMPMPMPMSIPSQALKASLPSEIYEAFARYFNADDIYRYYGVLLRAKRFIKADLLIEDYSQPFVEAIHAVVFAAKRGKVRNLANYFYSAFQSASAEACRWLARDKNKPSWLF